MGLIRGKLSSWVVSGLGGSIGYRGSKGEGHQLEFKHPVVGH